MRLFMNVLHVLHEDCLFVSIRYMDFIETVMIVVLTKLLLVLLHTPLRGDADSWHDLCLIPFFILGIDYELILNGHVDSIKHFFRLFISFLTLLRNDLGGDVGLWLDHIPCI